MIDVTTFMIVILYIAEALLAFVCHKALDTLSKEFEDLAVCHNRLCELVRQISESLNRGGIEAPRKERPTTNSHD